MQLICPNCGEPIPASNINIQKLAAVCPACNTVFSFDPAPAEPKIKHQKVKQPPQLELRDEDDTLHMAFRTNFRLDRDEGFISSAAGSLFFTFMTFIMAGSYFAEGAPILLPISVALVTLCFYYALALIVYNRTHIGMNDERIQVTRQPIPNFMGRVHEVSLAGVVAIRCEETAISKQKAYDTPRYRVWAELADGRQKLIVNDVTEDYAYFITQRLDERLHEEADVDVSRLEDAEHIHDEELEAHQTTESKDQKLFS